MNALTILLFALVIIHLVYLIINGIVTESVWVRGPRKGISLTVWAHKKERIDEPIGYWFFMTFYSALLVFILYLAICNLV